MRVVAKRIWLPMLGLALGVNLVIGSLVYSRETLAVNDQDALEKISVMMRVLHLIQKDYVEPTDIDYTSLIYSATKGMVSSLDPYSSFLTPREFADMIETTEGQFGGLGIVVTVRDGRLTVVTPMEGTPGSKAGIIAGDQIIEIDGEPVKDVKLSQAVTRLKGEAGTSVDLLIHRPDTGEAIELSIVRAVIEVPSVKGTQIVRNGIGYIRIVQFDERTAKDLKESLNDLLQLGATSLVLDLRNNPGGVLGAAVDVTSCFLPKGKLVVFTEGRQPSQMQRYYTGEGCVFGRTPIVVLINEGSASAAEIVAGCLQDHGRARLVGTQSFGKGSVQNVIRLPDGSALRLTTARYYTPGRQVIHEQGVTPDIEVRMTPEQRRRLVEAQVAINDDGLDIESDPQLQRAIEMLESYDVFRKADGRR